MADPGTIAAGMQVAGSVMQGIGGYQAGRYNRDAAYNAAIEEERAGTAEETRIREAARAAIGQQVAAQGANGFAMGTGSALDALAESQVNAAFDGLLARQQAARRARAQRAAGDIAMAQGKNALLNSVMGSAAKSIDWASDARRISAGTSPAVTFDTASGGTRRALDQVDLYRRIF